MKEKMENGKEMKTAAVLAATAFAVMAALVAQQAVWAADVAAIRVSGYFSDHMVLQRGEGTSVWGKAAPGTKVKVAFAGQSLEATADARGDWKATFAKLAVSKEGRDLVVGEKTFKDVLVGDVWISSGQSNAEMTFGMIGNVVNQKEEIARAKDFPNVRSIKVERTSSAWPIDFALKTSGWRAADAKTLPMITAMGYIFARDINAKTGIPIGIVDDSWSGQPIQEFLSPAAAEASPLGKYMKAWKIKVAEWHEAYASYMRGEKETLGDDFWPSIEQPLEGRIHNAMIRPIRHLNPTGVLWYQGCSNESNGLGYEMLLDTLIADWRGMWGEDLPFYVVQLASYTAPTTDPKGGNGFALVREAQRRTVAKTPRTGLAVTIDIGNAKNIHPANKLDVGARLARWALRDVYGEKNLVPSGPWYRSVQFKGNVARVSFDHVGGGLVAAEKNPDGALVAPKVKDTKSLKGFAVQAKDGSWHWAEATIDGNEVVVTAKDVAEPVAVRYAYRANPMGAADLYNAEGLPAVPFTTEK